MVIAGLRHIDRVRGAGWLDCPQCGEHAAQDVIDDMTFVTALGYRFTPVGRKRMLVCRRCGYRRRATADELRQLETGGRRIHRAVMFPIGMLGIVLAAGIVGMVWVIGNSSGNALAEKLGFTQQTGQGVFPIKFEGPSSWNIDPEGDQDPPYIKYSDSGGRMYFVIRRVTDSTSLEDMLSKHFNDEVGITTTGFPDKPPDAQSTEIAGLHAEWVRVKYFQGAENDEQEIYVLAHNGVGYVLTYVGLGDDAIKTIRAVADKLNGSLQFTTTETPPPAPSGSPSPSPSASPSATPKP